MVTTEYFYVYFLLLVLHFSVPLSADELIQNATTQTAVKDIVQTPNAISVPNSDVPPVFPKTSTDNRKVISANETLASPNIQNLTSQAAVNDVAQTPNAASVPNLDAPPELPNATTSSTKVISANDTLALTLNITLIKGNNTKPDCGTKLDNISTNNVTNLPSELPQKETNETTIVPKSSNDSLSAKPNLDDATLNKTETSTGQLPNALNTNERNSTNSTDKTDTEVPGLLDSPSIKSNISASVPDLSPSEKQNLENDQTEPVEDGKDTEESLRQSSSNDKSSSSPGVPLVQGQLAAILAAVFVIISVITYIGLLSWRRFLENRYGNRELLVNEDEFNDRDDMRHFTI